MLSKVKFSGRQVLLVGLMVVMLAGVVGTAAPISCPSDACQFTGTGVVRVSINSNSNAGIRLDLNGVPQWSVATVSGGDFQIYDETGQVNRLYIKTDSGNVGLGTFNPQRRLHVEGNALISAGGSVTNAGLEIQGASGSWGPSLGLNNGRQEWRIVTWSDNELKFVKVTGSTFTPFTIRNDSFQDALVITATGVGIGTAAPAARLHVVGDLMATGTKSFVQAHPADPRKEIVYVSLEGPEAGTYIRGTAQLINGEAVINLPEHFSLVTNDDGLTVQLTPLGEWLQLYVTQKSTKQLIVREASGKSGQFDYLVQGIRKGFKDHQVIRDKEP